MESIDKRLPPLTRTVRVEVEELVVQQMIGLSLVDEVVLADTIVFALGAYVDFRRSNPDFLQQIASVQTRVRTL